MLPSGCSEVLQVAYATVPPGGGKVLQLGTSKGEAKALLASKRLERLRGRREIGHKVDAPPFDQFVEGQYTEYARANKRGFYNEQYRLKQLTEFFGKRKLSELTAWDGENFKIEMRRHRAPAT